MAMNEIYGKKLGMTQLFTEDDVLVPVTVIQAEPNTVTQVKTADTDGYEAVQVGFGHIKPQKVNKPMQGHFDKQGTEPKKYLREIRVENAADYKVGDEQTVAAFTEVAKVDVTGTSKGKGFAGVIKRYGFGGGPGGHGAHFHRAPGSVGQCATPSRVFKGVRLRSHGLRHGNRSQSGRHAHRRGSEPDPGEGRDPRRQERRRARARGQVAEPVRRDNGNT